MNVPDHEKGARCPVPGAREGAPSAEPSSHEKGARCPVPGAREGAPSAELSSYEKGARCPVPGAREGAPSAELSSQAGVPRPKQSTRETVAAYPGHRAPGTGHPSGTGHLLCGYTKLVAFSTLLLIFAGAMVTSTGSGLAVPDWPLNYGM